MSEIIIQGTVWKCADGVTAYQIIPQQYWDIQNPEPDGQELAKHVFEDLLSDDGQHLPFCPGRDDILVAGRNFGCGGKSIAHPVLALRHAGVRLVVAESVSRYCYRNLVNLALPVLILPGICKAVASGDQLRVSLEKGAVSLLRDNAELQAKPLSAFALEMLRAGGAVNYYCRTI